MPESTPESMPRSASTQAPATRPRPVPTRAAALMAALVVALIALTGCGSDDAEPLRIRSDGSTPMRVAAAVYAGALARTGVPVDVDDPAGGDRPGGDPARMRELVDATARGEVDLFPALSGTLLSTLVPRPTETASADVEVAVNRALPQDVTIGDPAAVSDRPRMIAAQSLLEAHDVSALADCGSLPAGLPVVTTGVLTPELRHAFGGCRFGAVVERVAAAEVVRRAATGEALGVLTGFEAAADVSERSDVVVLRADGDGPIAQDLVPVYRSARIGKSQTKALSRVAGELTTADLMELVARVDRGADPRAVADEWRSTRGV